MVLCWLALTPAVQQNPWNMVLLEQIAGRFGLRCIHIDIRGRQDYNPDTGNTNSGATAVGHGVWSVRVISP